MRKSIFLGVAFAFVALIGFSSANSIGTSAKSDLAGEKSNSILSESRNTAATANATTLEVFRPRR